MGGWDHRGLPRQDLRHWWEAVASMVGNIFSVSQPAFYFLIAQKAVALHKWWLSELCTAVVRASYDIQRKKDSEKWLVEACLGKQQQNLLMMLGSKYSVSALMERQSFLWHWTHDTKTIARPGNIKMEFSRRTWGFSIYRSQLSRPKDHSIRSLYQFIAKLLKSVEKYLSLRGEDISLLIRNA